MTERDGTGGHLSGGFMFPGPKRDPWTVALHTGPADPRGRPAEDRPLGAGVLIDSWRVLTCLPVVRELHRDATPLWVAFPKAGLPWTVRRRVLSVRTDPATEVSVLVLAEAAPDGLPPAPLSRPDGTDLVGERWWAFGFPADAAFGGDASGHVGAALAYGWVRLETDPGVLMSEGFIGAGVWSARFEAVVGLVGRVQTVGSRAGEVVALTFREAGAALPGEGLPELAGWTVVDAGEAALAAWGWSLNTDAEAERHWRPRARGVAVESEAGHRFRGRRAALTAVVDWLDRPEPDDRVLVLTGSPGVGKSAVLGRVVTTADPQIREALPADDDNVRAEVGSVACAVHAKGKTALDVAVEIARAAAVRIPEHPAELAVALRNRLSDRTAPRFNLIIDALDEAVTPEQAQQVVEEIVLPVVRTCGQAGAQVVIGTRRSDDDGDLLPLFGADRVVVDLDSEQYFEVEDLSAYALATLRLVGAERHGNPYTARIAGPVAARIAELADRNFLVAGLTARRHGLYDTTAIRPDELSIPADVDAALEAYVTRLPAVGPAPAKVALTALAYAQAPGLSLELWQVVLGALGVAVKEDDLAEFVVSSAANFLVESLGELPGRRFRLFHQALNDALQRERRTTGADVQDRRAITDRLIRQGREVGWRVADRYLLRSLAEHAAMAGLIDDLLVDDEYLFYADLLRLIPPADYAGTILGQQRARLLRLTPQAAVAPPAERAAQFSVTAALEGLDARIAVDDAAPYRASWAAVEKRQEWAVLAGHTSPAAEVCALATHRGPVLASGGSDGTVRVWNPNTGQQERVLKAGAALSALLPVTVDGRTLIASGGRDGRVILWDPASGQRKHTLGGGAGQIRALTETPFPGAGGVGILCADGTLTVWSPEHEPVQQFRVHTGEVTAGQSCGPGRIVTAGPDGTVECWQVGAQQPLWSAEEHDGEVVAFCLLDSADGPIVASAGVDGTVRLRDAETGECRHTLETGATVRALCPVTLRGATLLATGGDDGVIRLWDAPAGRLLRELPSHGAPIRGLCAVEVHGRLLIASVGDTAVRLWTPDPGGSPSGGSPRAAVVTSVAALWHDQKDLVACAHANGSVHLRSASTGELVRVLTGQHGPITGLNAVALTTEVLLASACADDTVGVWKLRSGQQRPLLFPRPGWATAVCPVFLHRRLMLACAGEHGTVRLWDPLTGKELRRTWHPRFWRRPTAHLGAITVLCWLRSRSGGRIVSGGQDGTLRVWNLDTGRPEVVFAGHTGTIRAACVLLTRGADLIASAGDDQVIRIWDSHTGVEQHALQGHTSRVTAVCPVRVGDRTLLASVGQDGTARIWNPATGSLELTIPVHHEATACVAAADRLIIGTVAGTVAVTLNL